MAEAAVVDDDVPPLTVADVTKRAAADKTVDVATTAPVMPMTVNS